MCIPERKKPRRPAARRRSVAARTMLVELLVGLGLAGIAIAAAIAALIVARSAATSVHEMASLQQQASFALRTMGREIRSAGSLELQASPANGSNFRFAGAASPATSGEARIRGTDGTPGTSDSLSLAHTSPPLLPSLQRDCLGQDAASGARTLALFHVDAKGNLGCRSGSGQSQPLIGGVASFQLRYRVLEGDRVRSMSAGEIDAAQLWPSVQAVEVCLELRGERRATAPGRLHAGCTGQSADAAGRLVLVTRKLFLLNASLGG